MLYQVYGCSGILAIIAIIDCIQVSSYVYAVLKYTVRLDLVLSRHGERGDGLLGYGCVEDELFVVSYLP